MAYCRFGGESLSYFLPHQHTVLLLLLTVPPIALLIFLVSAGGPTNKLLPVSTIPTHPLLQPIFKSSPKANLRWKISIRFKQIVQVVYSNYAGSMFYLPAEFE